MNLQKMTLSSRHHLWSTDDLWDIIWSVTTWTWYIWMSNINGLHLKDVTDLWTQPIIKGKKKNKTNTFVSSYFLLILNTFIPKRQKNNISQHLFSHWLCLISFSILLNIQSNSKYSLHTSNFSPYKKCEGELDFCHMYIFHKLYRSGMEAFVLLWRNIRTEDVAE